MSEPRAAERAPRSGAAAARESVLGPQLLQHLYGALRGLRLYGSSHQALQEQVRQLMGSLAAVMGDEVALVGMGEHFFLNDVRLKPDPARVGLWRSLIAELESRGLGGLRFMPGISAAELEVFLRCVLAVRDAAGSAGLAEELARVGVIHATGVRLSEMGARPPGAEGASEDQREAGDGIEAERARAARNFRNAVDGTRGLVLRTVQTGRPALQLARRIVQPIVDSVLKNEFSIVGLTALKDHDEYTYAHCVNVSVLSISIGQKLGLPRAALANLGVAALMHDLGKLLVPAEVLQKPGRLTPEEMDLVRPHPLHGVRMISRLRGLMPLTLDCMRVAFQHHMNIDHSGYPQVPGGGGQAVFSRIVTVADLFDALTSHRAYRTRPYTGFEALRVLVNRRRQHLDPGATWALVRTVGFYPAGTAMITESDHVVLSVSPNPADLGRPYCRVLLRPDLSAPDPASPESWDPMPAGEKIARVLMPEEFAVDPKMLLAA